VPIFASSYVVPPDDLFIRKTDTIVLARAITSYTVETPETDIQTITEFAVSDTLKGFAARTLRVAIPGGSINGRVKMIGGAPSFDAGEEYLLFLKTRATGEEILSDFGLGVFTFKDEPGHRVVQRAAEIFGWNLDGSEHREVRRDADRFIAYIRSEVRGNHPAAAYVVPGAVVPEPEPRFQPKTEVVTALSFTGNSYMLDCGGGMGCAWAGFPVNWNQGNTEPGAPGSPAGKTAITSGFASWNGSGAGISYVYSTNNANTDGILEAADHVNNIVFEKNLGTPYNCASGGLLGQGGITSASGTHSHGGESYFTSSEGDVSMNAGIANCTTLFSSGNFNSAMTHELGHTLGFRHADKTRGGGSSCVGDPSLDCSSHAIMTAVVTNGLSGALQTWDTSAAQTVYGSGPVCTAPSISAQPAGSTITQGNSASLSVTAAGTSPTYQWYIGNPPTTSSPVAGGTTASISVSPASTTTYWVRVTNSCGTADSNAATVTVNAPVCNAPQVTTQPQSVSITYGNGTQLSVIASGTAPLSYQWYNGSSPNTANPINGGTTSSLAVTPVATTSYWVKVTNTCGSGGTANSNTATVTVNCAAPVINIPPGNKTITQGSSTSLTVLASGGPGLAYQWYQGTSGNTSSPVTPGGTSSAVTVSPTSSTSYWVRVSVTGCGSTDSTSATVIVNPNNGCPAVTIANPTAVQNGASFTLSTSASTGSGGGTVTITWFEQTSSGQQQVGTGTSITVSPTATTTYLAQATNTCGVSASASVTVTIGSTGCLTPTVTPLADETIGLGASTVLVVSATGTPTLHYQWYLGAVGDTSVPVGTDSGTFITGSLTTTTTYWVKVTNDCGNSSTGTITITVAPARRRPARH
jgi:hypothetical protein